MKKMFMRSCIWFIVLSLIVPVGGFAQDTGSAPPVFLQEELDQMLAPIALYPDSLLIQVLMAATYPLEVVQAARWLDTNPNLKDEKLAAALEQKSWDPSVKSLVNFPPVLTMMNDKLEWTQDLGDAFLGQKDQVMDSVQNLRLKAQAQGTLKTTREQVVVVKEKTIVIEPANPEVVYVPAYNPTIVYGPWWYPAYPPYYYYPRGYAVATVGIISFGVGVACGAAWGYAWGNVHWANRHVYVNPSQNIRIYNNYYSRPLPPPGHGYRPVPGPGHKPGPAPGPGPSEWRHDPGHRKGVAYKDPNVRHQYGQERNPGADARKDFRGFNAVGQDRPPKPGAGPGFEQRRDAGMPANHQPVQRRKDAAGREAVKRDQEATRQRNDPVIKNNAQGSRQTWDRGKDAVHRDPSTTPQNKSSGAIESLKRSGNEVNQQSERGRMSRESKPAQKPSQTFQGGKIGQDAARSAPNIGGNDVKQQSERGRPSRTPAQKPNQIFQDGKIEQGGARGAPNDGGGGQGGMRRQQ